MKSNKANKAAAAAVEVETAPIATVETPEQVAKRKAAEKQARKDAAQAEINGLSDLAKQMALESGQLIIGNNARYTVGHLNAVFNRFKPIVENVKTVAENAGLTPKAIKSIGADLGEIIPESAMNKMVKDGLISRESREVQKAWNAVLAGLSVLAKL